MKTSSSLCPATLKFSILSILLISGIKAEDPFANCKKRLTELLSQPQPNTTGFDIVYSGNIPRLKLPYEERPLTVTYRACREICGTKAGYNDSLTAFGILTTWILPVIVLFSNLPFESSNGAHEEEIPDPANAHPPRLTALKEFVSWAGCPQGAIAGTMWSIYQTYRCSRRSRRYQAYPGHRGSEFALTVGNDAFFVLSCIDQYEYAEPRENMDVVLWEGLFRPLVHEAIVEEETAAREPTEEEDIVEKAPIEDVAAQEAAAQEADIQDAAVEEAREKSRLIRLLLSEIAFQLRILKHRDVSLLVISMAFFLISFSISVVMAFSDLGDYTTAHSLALGLLVSWLPLSVFIMALDRNPTDSARSKILIERWLYNVSAIMRHTTIPDSQLRGTVSWWDPEQDCDLKLGHYVGQGRSPRYCGVAHDFIKAFDKNMDGMSRGDLNGSVPEYISERQPMWVGSWVAAWVLGCVIVSIAISTAFVISYNTPTIGVGCRSGLYLLLWLASSATSLVQFTRAAFAGSRSRRVLLERLSYVGSAASTSLLITIIFLHATGGLNTCWCKSSIFFVYPPSRWDTTGFMQFENSTFYREYYGVGGYWISATVVGLVTCAICGGLASWMRFHSRQLSKTDMSSRRVHQREWDESMSTLWLL